MIHLIIFSSCITFLSWNVKILKQKSFRVVLKQLNIINNNFWETVGYNLVLICFSNVIVSFSSKSTLSWFLKSYLLIVAYNLKVEAFKS